LGPKTHPEISDQFRRALYPRFLPLLVCSPTPLNGKEAELC
jgi:hypothetical protein